IRASSPGKGQGATFVIELPMAALTSEAAEYERSQSGELEEQTVEISHALRGVKVLVVEDDPDALGMVRRALEEREAVVGGALSSDEALRILSDESFDVIVSDIGMPVRDGYELIQEVRKREIQTPAIALTAFARAEDRTKSLSSGYQAHLS